MTSGMCVSFCGRLCMSVVCFCMCVRRTYGPNIVPLVVKHLIYTRVLFLYVIYYDICIIYSGMRCIWHEKTRVTTTTIYHHQARSGFNIFRMLGMFTLHFYV